MSDDDTMATFFSADVSVCNVADYTLVPGGLPGRYYLSRPGILLTVDVDNLLPYLFDDE